MKNSVTLIKNNSVPCKVSQTQTVLCLSLLNWRHYMQLVKPMHAGKRRSKLFALLFKFMFYLTVAGRTQSACGMPMATV
jgi:hypothetical protein